MSANVMFSPQLCARSTAGQPSSLHQDTKDALPQIAWIENARLADQFVNLVKAGNLREFEKFVKSFVERAQQLAEVTNLAAKRINCSQVWIPYTTVSYNGSAQESRIREMCVVAFRVDSVKRVLCLATDPLTRSIVGGPARHGLSMVPVKLPDDPVLLFLRIGKLVSLPRVVGPPPLA